MRLVIYTLQGCKVCSGRQELHNQLAELMNSLDIEQVGILIGQVNGRSYVPLADHDTLCRKPGDATKYIAPIYILETDDTVIKLDDMGSHKSLQDYVTYIQNTLANVDMA